MKFNDLLKKARKQQTKTLREVAASAGVSIGYISDMENGRRIPPVDVLRKIEDFLKVTDGRLVKEARKVKDFDVPAEAKEIFWRRPDLNLALLRASQEHSEEDINNLIRNLGKKSSAKEGC